MYRKKKSSKIKKSLLVVFVTLMIFGMLPLSLNAASHDRSTPPASQQTVQKTPSKPYLIISSYSTEPLNVSPGKNFKLKANIKNTSASTVKNILITIGGNAVSAEGEGSPASSTASGSLTVTGTGNSRYIKELGAGSEQSIEFDMISGPKTPPGLHSLSFGIEYSNSSGEGFTSSQQIGLKLTREIKLKFKGVSLPESVMAGENVQLNGELFNTNNFKVDGVSLEIITENAAIEGEPLTYIGTLDAGDSETIELNITPEDNAKIRLIAKYSDDFNQEQTLEESYEIRVEDPPPSKTDAKQTTDKKPKSGGFFGSIINFFKALLGL